MRRALSILTLNIGSPSVDRAQRLLEWLAPRPDDIFVLTETSPGKGTELVAERLSAAGWALRFPRPEGRERGVLVAARVALEPREANVVDYLPARAELAVLAGGELAVIGVYVPSRDSTPVKIERKRAFVDRLMHTLRRHEGQPAVLIGDLNLLEPEHQPRRPEFADWEYAFYDGLSVGGWHDAYRLVRPQGMEYSWIGPEDDGYRFDHVFVTSPLVDDVEACGYLHEPRELGLTDHSAMAVQLTAVEVRQLETDASLNKEHNALF